LKPWAKALNSGSSNLLNCGAPLFFKVKTLRQMRLVLSRAKENASGGKWIELVEVEGGWVGGAAMGWVGKTRKGNERKGKVGGRCRSERTQRA